MTLRHLKILIKVADLKSITGAAKVLYVSQPTVSQAILEIERHYKVKIFDRISKKLYITEAGERLLDYARHIQSLFEEMEHSILDIEKNGNIKVGASLTIGSYLLPKMLKEFHGKFPGITVNAVIKNTREIENLIMENQIDFGIVEGAIHLPNIISLPFMEDDVVLVCGKNHPLFAKEKVSFEEVSTYPFILREKGSGTRELFESVMAARDKKCEVIWEAAGSDVIKNFVMEGIGIGVISELLVENEIKAGKLRSIGVDGLQFKRKFHVIYHINKYLTQRAQELMKICENIEI